MKFTIEFHRETCEKAFLEVEANYISEAMNTVVASDDPRLEFEPISSVMEVHNVKPSES